MAFTDKEIKDGIAVIFVGVLAALTFFLLRPVLTSIIAGFILAYVMFPIHKRILRVVKERNTATSITTAIILLVILIPLWFLTPIMINQAFEFFRAIQSADLSKAVGFIFPTASEAIKAQMITTLSTFTSKISSYLISALVNIILDSPLILLYMTIVAFVFFFALRDHKEMMEFIMDISPLSKTHEKILINKFKEVTDSIVYGQLIVGIVQGLATGLALFLFGVPNPLFLTIAAITLSIVPITGPFFVWAPVTLYLLYSASPAASILYLIYNLIVTSTIDNVIRPYIVAKRSNVSSAVVMVGMMSGIVFFGAIGIILGPLLLVYLVTVLSDYRHNKVKPEAAK